MSGDLINAALRKNKGLFYQYSTQNFSYAVQAQRFIEQLQCHFTNIMEN